MKTLIISLIALFTFSIATSQSAGEKGLQIAKEADLRDIGFGNTKVNLTMLLRNQHGQESTREMRNQTLEMETDGDKSLIIFDTPRDVKGTATLTFTHKVGSDDQWLFLPAINRVKRISSSNKSGPFMGSEFAYEDLSSQEVEKYTYKYIKDEQANGADSYVIERYPEDEKSGYTKQIAWYNKENYRLEKVEFYDRKESLLKTLTYLKYNLYLDKYWRANQMSMVNHQSGKETHLNFDGYEFKTDLNENDFTQVSLQRAR